MEEHENADHRKNYIETLLKKYDYFSNLKRKNVLTIIRIYGSAFLLGIAAVLFEYWADQSLGKTSPFFFSFAAIAISAWYGGLFAGLTTTVVTTLSIDFFLLPPYDSFLVAQTALIIRLVIFFAEGFLISFLFEKCQHAGDLQGFRKREKDYIELITFQKELYDKALQEIKSRDEFLSIASHELKTPLTSMLIKLQSALRNIRTVSLANFSVENLMNMLESAEQQILRLSKMINDLLNVSLITTGRIDLELEDVDLKKIVEDVAERFAERLKQEGYQLNIEAKESVIGKWDKIRLEQVVSNLLSNAIKYGKGKPITIKLGKHNEAARITVHDEGIGISPEHHDRIFALFERGVSSKDYKGLGIGLYITNQIVIAHQGRIRLESKADEGSTFVIELPIGR